MRPITYWVGPQREVIPVTYRQLASVVVFLAFAILCSCMPPPASLEESASEESSIKTVITPTVLSINTATGAPLVGTDVLTPVVRSTANRNQAEATAILTAIATMGLDRTDDYTSTVPAALAETTLPTHMDTHSTIANWPADTIASYWQYVNNRDYKSAWGLLSDRFRQRNHEDNYSHYRDTYRDMNLCGVKVIDIETIEDGDLYAIVSAHISYLTGSTCDYQRDFIFDFKLTREARWDAWEIDLVIPVANRNGLLGATTKCDDNMAAVVPSSLNVRTGPGAGRESETLYPIQSYLHKNECVAANATSPDYSWVRISNAPRADVVDGWVAVSFLALGNAHPQPALLPVIAEPTPPPLPMAPTLSDDDLQPIGIEHLGDTVYVCYDIQGGSGSQLAFQMDELGPYDSDGNKTWAIASLQYVISGGTCYSDGTVDLSDVAVSLNSTITMPCWYPPPATDPAEISRFDDLMQEIAQHELRHVEIAWQWAHVLEEQLRDSNTCDQATLNTIYNQVWADEEAAQDAYHASPEGKIVPYP